jgi:hypothetical protein
VADRRGRSALAAGTCALLLVAAAWTPVDATAAAWTPVDATAAAWADRETATATLSVRTLPPVPNFACPADGATFTWTTPPAPYPDAVVSGYEFSYVQVGTGNAPTVIALPPTATSTSIPPSVLILLASYTVTITAKYTNWVTPPATRTLHVVLELLGIKVFACGA